MALVQRAPVHCPAPILSLPEEILRDILNRSLPRLKSYRSLATLSSVCRTFQKIIRSSRSLYVSSEFLDKLASYCPLESDYTSQVSKLIHLVPSAVSINACATFASAGLPPEALFNWSKAVRQTLIHLELSGLTVGHLQYMAKFERLEELTVHVDLENDWLPMLKKCDPLPSVKILKVWVGSTCHLTMFKPFLDLFPNLKVLGINVRCIPGFDEALCVEHSRLESLDISIHAPVVSIICPKLTSLSTDVVRGAVDIKSALSLKKFHCRGSYKMAIEMSKVKQSEISHLMLSASTDTRVLQALFFNCRDSLQDVIADTIEPLTRYQESLRVSTGSSKLPCFSSLTHLNVHNIKLSAAKIDYLGRVTEDIDDRLYLTLDNWITASPALKELFVTYEKSETNSKYEQLFMDAVISKFKSGHPGVTIRVQSGKAHVGLHLLSWY